MIGVILAAGISSRLRPLTDAIPKSLLPVGGKPLLQRALESLRENGIRRSAIITGYRREMIEQFVASLRPPLDVTFLYNGLYRTTNNNYSLWLAGTVVQEEMVMLDADILFDRYILDRLLSDDHADALVVRSGGGLGDEEIKVQLDDRGRLIRIGKDIPPLLAAGESIGIEKFSLATAQQLFSTLGKRKNHNEFYEASFQEIIDNGAEIFAVDTAGHPCMEIDTPEDLAAAEELSRSLTP
jgi:choline kinase